MTTSSATLTLLSNPRFETQTLEETSDAASMTIPLIARIPDRSGQPGIS
jgi:hypothetical protein